MKARSIVTLATLACFAAAAAPSMAGEAKTYKIVLRERHKVGDVQTNTGKEIDAQHVVVKTADGAIVNEQKTDKTTTYQLVEKAVEVDDQGRITKGLLYFVSWSLESEGVKDDSLTGLHVEVTGLGKLRTWKVLTPGKTPGDGAKEYLDTEFGNKKSEEESMEDVLQPKKELEVGESWNPDIAALVKSFGDQFKVDVAKSTAKATLTGVEGTIAEFLIEIALQTVSVGSPAGEMAWKEGGRMTMRMEGKHSLVENDPTGDGKMGYELKGIAEVQGATVSLEVSGSKEGGSKQGGDMPAVPAAPEGK